MYVGYGGQGTYTLSGTSSLTSLNLYVGLNGGVGIFNQSGGVVNASSGSMWVGGQYSNGTYNISGGSLVVGYDPNNYTENTPNELSVGFLGGLGGSYSPAAASMRRDLSSEIRTMSARGARTT